MTWEIRIPEDDSERDIPHELSLAIRKNLIPTSRYTLDKIIQWYSGNIDIPIIDASPMYDGARVWFNEEQYNRTVDEWVNNSYEDGMLAEDSYGEYLINKRIYEKFLLEEGK